MRPSPEADRVTLIRRLCFDLTGLPPTPEQVDAFVGDPSPDAYEALVDRLLASPHYGERMAAYWLDLVRFADTTGYHGDNHRNVTLYRDYVIRAFNDDMPFDRFTVEQLAGDLLPGATDAQKVASGYNMLLMTTQEGGAQAKEYLAKYSADRVRNASTVWMGATLGCAECHDHKYDPFTTRDFYRFAAFFADLKERPVGAQEETAMPSPEQAARLRQLDEQMAALRRTLATPTPELDADQVAWEESLIADPKEAEKLPAKIARILNPESADRTDEAREVLAAYYRSNVAPQLAATRDDLADRERRKAEVDRAIPRTLIATSVAPRVIRILPRGNWLDESGPSVTPAVPAFLAPARVRRTARDPARPGPVARRSRQPAGRARLREPALETGVRPGAGGDARRLRRAGRLADPSRAARLAGDRVHGPRLGGQTDAPADGPVGNVPAVVPRRRADPPARPV